MSSVAIAYEGIRTSIDGDGSFLNARVPYNAYGVSDELEAISIVHSNSPQSFKGLNRNAITIADKYNDTNFVVDVEYSPPSGTYSSMRSQSTFSFDTTGGTRRIYKSKKVITQSTDAPDLKGAIAFDGQTVNGVDVHEPRMVISETKTLKPYQVTDGYINTLARNTGKINKSSFRQYKPYEALFIGASGTRAGTSSSDKWQVTFNFAISWEEYNIEIGDLTLSIKQGWHYLDILYGAFYDTTVKKILKKPTDYYVHQIYDEVDFSFLGASSRMRVVWGNLLG